MDGWMDGWMDACIAAWAVALVRLHKRLVSFCGWHPGVAGCRGVTTNPRLGQCVAEPMLREKQSKKSIDQKIDKSKI